MLDQIDPDRAFAIIQEKRARRNEEIALWRGPSVELFNISEQSATELAKSVIQVGLILNGGAIVALPAICAIFSDGIGGIERPIITSGVLFASGLVTSWITSIVAYFAICLRQNYYNCRIREDTQYVLAAFSETPEQRDGLIKASENTVRLAAVHNVRYGRLRVVGIVLCFLSFFLFCTGSLMFAWALLIKVQTIPIVI